jgi:ribosomal protein S18 acetylase RimI-like enzyme
MIKYKTEWPTHNLYHYLIIINDKVVASCNVEINNGYTKLQALFIQKDYRKKGYAKEIINEIINDFNDDIYLLVHLDNTNAILLYDSLGFIDYKDENGELKWMVRKK